MTSCLLVRHAHTAAAGRVLTGTGPGAPLTDLGRQQALALADRLRTRDVAAIYTSPRDRAATTAAILGERLHLPVAIEAGLDEIDFGAWTGSAIADLTPLEAWQAFNQHRATTRIDGAGFLLEMQARLVRCLVELVGRHPGRTFVAVTHADPIRAAIAAVTGTSLDLVGRFDVDPASLTELVLGPGIGAVRCVNDVAHLAGHASCTASSSASARG